MSMSRWCRSYGVLGMLSAVLASGVEASSHREAPFVTEHPKVDGTDFYMFNSYESGRTGFVTIIANYVPLQDAYGGPNYFTMDPEAHYNINIDNDGDAKEDVTFRFRFKNTLQNFALPIGSGSTQRSVSIPLIAKGGISAGDVTNLNVVETYTVEVVSEGRRRRGFVTNNSSGLRDFLKPVDNIGTKTIANYSAYASSHIYNISVPGCSATGSKMFVGQRAEPFVVNLGETFDLINYNAAPPVTNSELNTVADKNITSLILEIPAECLRNGDDTVIAGWTTATLPRVTTLRPRPSFGDPTKDSADRIQVSRLANPLVNEVVIGLKDKDRFNASLPSKDSQFATYVTHPTLPVLIQAIFNPSGLGSLPLAPTLIPRTDLVAVFLTGVDGLNKTDATAELMRLNTSTTPVAAASQNRLGVIGGDNAGYPNGRRPGDDVVDISLRVVMGALIVASNPTAAPSGSVAFSDGALVSATDFQTSFPYLNTPTPGSPDPDSIN